MRAILLPVLFTVVLLLLMRPAAAGVFRRSTREVTDQLSKAVDTFRRKFRDRCGTTAKKRSPFCEEATGEAQRLAESLTAIVS